MVIVARDGSGDYTSLQEAIDRIPDGSGAPTLILIRRGVYQERVVIHRNHVRLVGESAEDTVLMACAAATDRDRNGLEKGTFRTATLMITGNDVEIDHLTIRNDAGDGRAVGQAVAVYAAGDRGVFRGCRLIAHQDTLFCGPLRIPNGTEDTGARCGNAEAYYRIEDGHETHSRQYFEDCYIEGDVDFIFGCYRSWFERCTLHMGPRGGWYTAANTSAAQPYGFVFHRCELTGSCAPGQAFLGRPWRGSAATVFLDCGMDEHVAPEGFTDWDAGRRVTARCGEWHTRGARADQSTRHPAQKRLTEEDALVITLPAVLGGWDGWRPDRPVPTWFLCGDSTMANYGPEAAPMTGWGQRLQPQLPDAGYVQNEAVCGRSSKSFVEEGRLRDIASCLRAGDRLVISFSHNDEKEDPARHTTPEQTFPEYLNRFIDTALERGAQPILATPIARRVFDQNGHPVPTHGIYPETMRELAKRRNIPLIDLERATMALLEEEGEEKSKRLFCHVAQGHLHYPEGLADNSHLHERGAARIAKQFVEGLMGKNYGEVKNALTEKPEQDLEKLIAREDLVMSR